jgi:hypothetical protein
MAAGLVVAFLPHLAWQNVLWGFQSEVYFVLLFSIAAFALLRPEHSSLRRKLAGLAAGGGAMLAMGPGLLVPAALLGLTVIRGVEQRENLWHGVRRNWPALLLLLAAAALHRDVAAHAALHPRAPAQFFAALGRAAAWPHVWTPLAALAVNLPVLWLMIARLARRRRAVHNEDFVTLLSVWALALVVAMAWTRGGSDEFDGGVPSRYADFLILLTIGNVWSLITLLREAPPSRIRLARAAAWGWIAFLFLGWLALSSEIMTRLVLPRWRDPDGPVRAAVAFQRTHDFSVFVGQPLLYLPDPNRETLIAVLDDPRMQGRLPPSLQPAETMGPWSKAVRRLLGRVAPDPG